MPYGQFTSQSERMATKMPAGKHNEKVSIKSAAKLR